MIIKRPAKERGYFDFGWLQTAHTFSFGDYYDPSQMGFRNLRVINQDVVAPGQGFGKHRHHNMEIITYVIRGAVAHKDSMNNETIIHAGEIQRMSAGMGVAHSEFNASDTDLLELLQIWILPNKMDLLPSYQQNRIDMDKSGFQLLVSPDEEKGALLIHQDVKLYLGKFSAGQTVQHALMKTRYAWLQIIHGELLINQMQFVAGDGAAVSDEDVLDLIMLKDTELLMFDLN